MAEEYEFQSEDITDERVLKRGDHLAVEGQSTKVEYYHHGIYLGPSKGVADFGGDGKQGKPRNVSLSQFTDNGKRRLSRIVYTQGTCLPSEEAAQEAEKLIENPDRWGPYNLISNNCEHFATKCKTGYAVSKQVIEKIRYCISNPMAIVAFAMAASGSSGLSSGSF